MMTQVLVVDDDQPTREVLRMMLEDAGYEVVEAPNGTAALELLRASEQRMVALVDQVMPGVDGIAVLSTLADDPQLAARHAYVLMTAGARPLGEPEVALLSTLSAPLLRKPFDIDVLLEVVAEVARRVELP
jgi:CheY-like chemotaxis protein